MPPAGVPRSPGSRLRSALEPSDARRSFERSRRHHGPGRGARRARACRDGAATWRGSRASAAGPRPVASVRRLVVDEGTWVGASIDRAQPERKPLRVPTAPDAASARPGGRVRRLELSAGVLGGGRRHRFGPRGRMPGGGEGASGASRHQRAGGCGDRRRRAAARGMPDGVFGMVHGASPASAARSWSIRRSVPSHSPDRCAAAARCSTPRRAVPTRFRSTASWARRIRSSSCLRPWRRVATRSPRASSASMTLGSGQFCTNPGVAILDGSSASDGIRASRGQLIAAAPAGHHGARRHQRGVRSGHGEGRGARGRGSCGPGSPAAVRARRRRRPHSSSPTGPHICVTSDWPTKSTVRPPLPCLRRPRAGPRRSPAR